VGDGLVNRFWARAILIPVAALALPWGVAGCARNRGQAADRRPTADSANLAAARHDLGLLVSERYQAGTLWLWDTDGGNLRELAPDHWVHGFCFSPDGTRIAFTGQRRRESRPRELWVLDLASDAVEQVTVDFWAGRRKEIAWRPGTEQVVLTRDERRYPEADLPNDGGLWLVDVGTGEMTCLIQPADAEWPMCQQPRFSTDGVMVATKREGRYAAVLQVDDPEHWLRLDSPKYMNPEFLMDWVWRPDAHTLLLAATTARRNVGAPGQAGVEVLGPGGVWEWPLAEQWAVITPQLCDWEWSDQQETAAQPLFGQGTTVFGLALSNDGKRLAYVTPEGVWLRELESGQERHLLALELSDASELDAEWGAGLPLAQLSWSPDDRYLWANPGDGASCVIEVAKGDVIPVPKPAHEAAWRPQS
jgi:dipeptidyl aminopeptidase/acylaminoacyl peptidase